MATVSSEKPAKAEQSEGRGRRHTFTGLVVSDKTDKTRVITVARQTKHLKYEKIIRRRSKFYIHDEKNESKLGDTIEVMATRRLSKLKRWRLVKVVKKARRAKPAAAGSKS